MNIFEFYFNPKETKKNFFCKHISFLPKNIYEENIGPVFLFLILKTFSAKEKFFVEELTRFIRKEFYKKQGKTFFVFREGIKKINEFLEDKTREGIPLLGNLNLSIINLNKNNFIFSKIGAIDFFLIRGKKFFNLQKQIRVKKQKIVNPFFNYIFMGKLLPQDILFVTNEEISKIFEKEKIFDEIKNKIPLREIELRKIFNQKKEKMKKAFGLCVVFNFSSDQVNSIQPEQRFLSFLEHYELPFSFHETIEKISKNKGVILIFLFLFILFLGLILFS